MKLAGRVALISGAGGGIGRAISRAFVAAGAAVARCQIDAAAEETAFLASNAAHGQSPGRATLPKNRMSGSRPKLPIRHLVGSTFW